MNQVIHIIGLGVTETAQPEPSAVRALQQAELVIGSQRQLDTVTHLLGDQQISVLPPLKALPALLNASDAKNIAVLASGDPLFFGIGRWFLRRYPPATQGAPVLSVTPRDQSSSSSLRFYPAVSSIQPNVLA